MCRSPLILVLCLGCAALGADVESRVLTHYLPQDLLETVVRKEGWTELTLNVKGGVRKGDVVRIWAGGSIDRGGDQPGENVNGPDGLAAADVAGGRVAPSPGAAHAYPPLFKMEGAAGWKTQPAGQAQVDKRAQD